jgi:anti-anti-sigma factor
MSEQFFGLEFERSDDSLLARLSGEIDLSNAAQVHQQLDSSIGRYRLVILDLSSVEYLDSQGLRLIKQICDKADLTSTKLKLVAPPQSAARQVLDLAQMKDYVEIVDTLEA